MKCSPLWNIFIPSNYIIYASSVKPYRHPRYLHLASKYDSTTPPQKNQAWFATNLPVPNTPIFCHHIGIHSMVLSKSSVQHLFEIVEYTNYLLLVLFLHIATQRFLLDQSSHRCQYSIDDPYLTMFLPAPEP